MANREPFRVQEFLNLTQLVMVHNQDTVIRALTLLDLLHGHEKKKTEVGDLPQDTDVPGLLESSEEDEEPER